MSDLSDGGQPLSGMWRPDLHGGPRAHREGCPHQRWSGPGPDPAGNVRLELTNSGWRYHVITAKDIIYTPPEERFTSHFATCPAAARYRREPPRRHAGSEVVDATVRAAYPDNVIPFPARKTSQTEGERR